MATKETLSLVSLNSHGNINFEFKVLLSLSSKYSLYSLHIACNWS